MNYPSHRRTVRRLTFAAILIHLAWAVSRSTAAVVGPAGYVCPVCGRHFSATTPAAYTTAGADAEGRPFSLGMDVQEFRAQACPYCHYAGFTWNFPGDGASDVPAGETVQRIRDALAKRSSPSVR